ncbi:hypothetical protein D3C86_2136370 [compost metagenome]
MRMHRPGEILGGSAELHHGDRLGQDLGDVGPDHVDAQDPIGLGIGEDLDEAAGIVVA